MREKEVAKARPNDGAFERAVRQQLAKLIAYEIEGDEQLMKEVWELCEDDQEEEEVRAELGRIKAWLLAGGE